MADTQPSGRTITRVRNPADQIPVVYANSIEVGMSVFDVVLILGHVLEASEENITIQQLMKVALSPQHALVFSRLLAENLSQYEKLFGAIPEPREGHDLPIAPEPRSVQSSSAVRE